MKEQSKQGSLPLPLFQSVWETKGIFSDHYIRTKLHQTSLWPKEEEVKPLYEFCYELWNKRYIGLAQANEAVTRQELLDKILTKLGFSYLPNTRFPMGGEPDYILFSDENTKEQVFEKDKHTQYSAAVGILEAKKVNHPLDAVSRQETPGRFPHQQIRDYLQSATDSSGKLVYFRWAILTNGNKWRLYCRDTRPEHYFEFDFEHGIRSFKDFMVFVALFNPTAFIKNEEGHCLLDDVRSEALSYQAELEDNLCKRVFNILINLANGFYQRPENKITQNDLDKLYEHCLIFLYRLLFVLYAEGRGLLPMKGPNKNYRERYSLQRLLYRFGNPRNYISNKFTDLYEEILDLFHLIDGDRPSRNEACDVPLYDGRLFDSNKYLLLEQWRIGEQTLAEVLKGLMFGNIPTVRGEQRDFNFGETIDYADLEVRQLGSIYEGLLENHLEIEEDNLILKGDKSERKATGTYYTPDYIVQYIVKNTLEPLCKEIHESKKVQTAIKKTIQDNSFAEEVLKLKVLDPAMGSGHFLVRATEFLAEQILYHPTTLLQVETVPKGLSHEQAEISYWRRKVVESCVYGVDLNPLAVELAKLSLWLTCITTDQPLSFLDHHLRVGNSLIGAKLADLGSLSKGKTSKQFLFSFGPDLPKAVSEAIRTLKEIGEIESRDIQIVKNKEERWRKEVLEKLEPYRTIADLWTMSFLDMKIDEETYCKLAGLLSENPKPRTKKAKDLKQKISSYNSYLKTAEEKKFFHWEFEFPEVFFNEDGTPKENPGFDAVIGNPPYVDSENMTKNMPEQREVINKFYIAAKGNWDLYIIFIEQGLNTLKHSGIISYIVPNKLIAANYSKEIRKILSEYDIKELRDFSNVKVFKDVNVYPIVFRIRKNKEKEDVLMTSLNLVADVILENKVPSKIFYQDIFWDRYFTKKELLDVILKISKFKPLESFSVKVSAAATVSEAYEIKKYIGNKSQDISRNYKKLINTGTLDPYWSLWGRQKMQYIKDSYSYPVIADKDVIKINPIRYEQSKSTKIIIGGMTKVLECFYDEGEYLACKSTSIILSSDSSKINLKFLVALLNSPLISFWYKNYYKSLSLAGGYLRINNSEIKTIPIPDINSNNQKPFIDLVDKILAIKAKNPEADISTLEHQIDQMVYKLYGLTEEEIKVVENSRNK